MLESELDKFYIVYPSWAEFSYKWSDLPLALSDPVRSPYFRPVTEEWREHGYPEKLQRFELLEGAGGNGVIVAHIRRGDLWLPWTILHSEANVGSPGVMTYVKADFRVRFLDPMYFPPLMREGRPPRKSYICAITAEHVESAGDEIYWVVGLNRNSRQLSRLDEVQRVAHGFGLGVDEMGNCAPEHLLAEMTGWFKNPDYMYRWYKVTSTNRGAGFHFAVAVYLGLHLKWKVGISMHFMHLVAQIPGKPNVRKSMKHW